jgi:hypothetical protein
MHGSDTVSKLFHFFAIGLGLKVAGFYTVGMEFKLVLIFFTSVLPKEIIMTIDQFDAYTFSSIAYI